MRPIILQSIILILSILLIKFSWFFVTIPILLLITYSVSYVPGKIQGGYSLGWAILGRGKRVVTDRGRFWTILMKADNGYEVYVFRDRLLYLEEIGSSFTHNDLLSTKEKIKRIIDRYWENIDSKNGYESKIRGDFKNWDGCLTKEDSRDKKLKKVVQ